MEAVKKILAYQRTPLILTCEQTGSIPEDFFVSLTGDEKEYIQARMRSKVEPLVYELLSQTGAACVLPTVSHLLMDVHREPPRARAKIDSISIPLVEEQGTAKYLLTTFCETFREDLSRVVKKTEQRFGKAHVIHISVLPQFIDGTYVDCGIVQRGKRCIEAKQAPKYCDDLYDGLFIRTFSEHSWIGIPERLLATASLRKEVFATLSGLFTEVVVEQ